MIWYNLKLTLRRIFKEKAFSAINIFGLVVGIASFLILFLYVANEKSFDKHFRNYPNIYRVTSMPLGLDNSRWARSLGMIHEAAASIPEVEKATWFTHTSVCTIKIGEQQFQQKDILSVDHNFVDLFEVKARTGNLSELESPNVAFVSERFAQKYFKDENPVGKLIEIDALQYLQNLGKFEIRGVIENTHPKTHFNCEILLSQKGALAERYTSLHNLKILWTYNYFLLKDGADPGKVSDEIHNYFLQSSLVESLGPKDYKFELTPLSDIHLYSNDRFELKESTSKINIGLFVVISFVVLLVSLLNFINLTIARLIKRSKEMGLKKSVGATRNQLIQQILSEVFLICSVAIVLAVGLIEAAKPFINKLFEIEFQIYFSEPVVYLSILAVLAICLGLTVLFVGFFLFGKNTSIDNLLAARNNFSGSFMLKSLLVGQVTIVIILMSATFLVNKQIGYIFKQALGYDKENVVVLHLKDYSKDPGVFANELKKQSAVASVGFTRHYFGYPAQSFNLESFGMEGTAEFVFANYDYLKTMNIQLAENWMKATNDTVRGMVINEHLYKRILAKYGSIEALNTYTDAQALEPGQIRFDILGVTKDFNYGSMHEPIGDFAFWLDESNAQARFIHVRLNPGNLHVAMNDLGKVWDAYYPGQEFNYFFLDDQIASQYKAESILSRILTAFSVIAILVSMIGISALALFISQQRTKEIGIRKVNGATIAEVLALLNKDFVRWVAVAFMVAAPLAWYVMFKWLESFAYKTALSWWIFAFAGLLALGIALLTVSFQSWKAASRNPIESLRYE